MFDQGINGFSGKNVLLLQGPVGPFFSRLARDLAAAGARVSKVNFNAGDWFFYRRGALSFREPLRKWPAFLAALIDELDVDVILLFGDCRPIHRVAHEIAVARQIELGVFEEGYVRPDYLTFERHGVNANSQMPRNPLYYLNRPAEMAPPRQRLPNPFWHMVAWAFLYYLAASIGYFLFPFYQHHRPLNPVEAWPWLRSAWRRQLYRWKGRRHMSWLTGELSGRFFLVPLQVHNDSQVLVHSPFPDVETFIGRVMQSFAGQAAADAILVIKHHPMDRGYRHYGKLVAGMARQLGIARRCLYVHDLHMPTVLRHARGVVVINSVSGLQALQRDVPVKVMGRAIYDIQGMCFRGGLDDFWRATDDFRPSLVLVKRFLHCLVLRTQVNASFYRVAPESASATGISWVVNDRPAGVDADVRPRDQALPVLRQKTMV